MALGTETTDFLRGTICALTGLLLLVVLAVHWHAVAVVIGGYWLARGVLSIYRAHARPQRVASTGVVAVLSLVAGLLVVMASPLGAGVGLGLSVVIFIGLQALITGAVDITQGLVDGRHIDCGFGLVALTMGIGLWFVPFVGFEVALAMMGFIVCTVGLGAMIGAAPRRHRRLGLGAA